MNKREYQMGVERAAREMQGFEPESVEDIIWDDRQWLANESGATLANIVLMSEADVQFHPDDTLYEAASKVFCADVKEYLLG